VDHSLIFNVFPLQLKRPGGGHRIATVLREEGWDVEVVDWAAEWQLEELKELVKSRVSSRTVFFGFSSFFAYWNPMLEEFTKWMKQTYPTIPIVLGGQSRPRQKSEFIDYYITGYGENAILELIKHFKGTATTPLALDLRFTDKKVIVANHSYVSYPMRKSIIRYELRDYISSDEFLTVEYSRGCMFKCLYCNFPVLGVKGDYTRDADDYIEQLQETYDKWGVTKYIAADETFNDRTDKIIKFADATDKLSFKPFVSGFIRADLLVSRKQDWEHLERLGFLGQYYGVESMHWPSAKSIGKGMHPEKLQIGLLEAKKYFKRNNGLYRGHISLIAGLPYETEDTLEKTINWCEQNWQGEGMEIWPLEIPINDTYDVPSLLTTKWKEYGYRQKTKNTIMSSSNSMVDEESYIAHGICNLDWETDTLSFDQCKDLADKFNKRLRDAGAGIGSLAIQEFSSILTLKETLELEYNQNYKYKDKKISFYIKSASDNLKEKIKNYINRKLSL